MYQVRSHRHPTRIHNSQNKPGRRWFQTPNRGARVSQSRQFIPADVVSATPPTTQIHNFFQRFGKIREVLDRDVNERQRHRAREPLSWSADIMWQCSRSIIKRDLKEGHFFSSGQSHIGLYQYINTIKRLGKKGKSGSRRKRFSQRMVVAGLRPSRCALEM